MKKVYLVSLGCYSDFHIIAVFSSLEEAQKTVDYYLRIGGYDNQDAELHEWDIDESFISYRTRDEEYRALTKARYDKIRQDREAQEKAYKADL